MNKSNDWYSFYKPYIKISNLFNIDTIVEHYIKQNYSELIKNQFEQYKEQGRYTRAGEFIDKEIKAGLKNPDSYYLELKKDNRKDITDILSKIKKLPLIVDYVDYIEDLIYRGNGEYSNLRDTLELGATFLNRPECCHYLLWIFSTTDVNSDNFHYGSNYLKDVAKLIKDKAEQFNSIDDSYYKISLECFKPYINVNNFLTQENTLGLYIRTKYPSILKDEYEYFKKKYERFKEKYECSKEDLTQKKILESYIETNYPNFPKDEYGHLKDKLTQDTFMRVNNLYNGYDDGRYLYNSLAKRKKKLDNELLKKFREFKVLKEANDTTHSKEIKRLNHIRLALQFGALAFQKFPTLITPIMTAIEDAKYEGYGIRYLNELSKKLFKGAYNELELEEEIEFDYQQQKNYNDNMSKDEYDMAKLLGFDI